MKNYDNNLEEIIKEKPSWFTRNGFTAIFITNALILLLFRMVDYPEQLEIPVRICSYSLANGDTIYKVYGIVREDSIETSYLNKKARIEITNYPARQYGILAGRISNMTTDKTSKLIRIEITLNKRPQTSKNIRIPIKDSMIAKCTLVYYKESMLTKLLEQITTSNKHTVM